MSQLRVLVLFCAVKQLQGMKIAFNLSVLLIFFCFNILNAQNDDCEKIQNQLHELSKKIRSMDAAVFQAKADSLSKFVEDGCSLAKVELNIVNGHAALENGNLDQALAFYDAAHALSKDRIKYRKKITNYYSKIYLRREEYEKCLDITNEALEIPCPESDKDCHRLDVILYSDKAIFLKRLDRGDEALEAYHSIESLVNKYGTIDSMVQASIFNAMGIFYKDEIKDFRQSVNYYKKSLSFIPEGNRARYLIQNNTGFAYLDLEEKDSARLFFNRTIEGTTHSRYLITAYQGLGAIANREKNYPDATKYYGLALKSAKEAKKSVSIYKSRIFVAKSHYLNGDFIKAQQYLDKAIASRKDAEESSKYSAERSMYSNLIQVALKDKDLSYGLYQDFLNYDTLAINQRTKILDKSISKYEKRILKDSLDKAVLLQSFEEQKAKNYKLGSLVSILGLLLASLLALQFKNRFMKQKSLNKELIFQNNELQKVNEQLEQKAKALLAKPILTEGKKEVSIKTTDKTYFIPMDKITYVQAEDDGVRVYYEDTSKWTDVSLKNFQQELDNSSFVQIGRGVVVNIKHIAWINTSTLKMKAGAELKIGRTYKPQIKAMLES